MNYVKFEGISLKTNTVVYYVYSIISIIFDSVKGVRLFSYTHNEEAINILIRTHIGEKTRKDLYNKNDLVLH